MSSSLIIRHARNSGTTIIGGGGGIGFQTLALLNADLAHDENTLAEVTNDAPNNGTYIKVGASGAGSWLKSTNDVSGRVTDLETNAVLNVGGEVQDDTSFGGKLEAPGNDLTGADEVVTRSLGDERYRPARSLDVFDDFISDTGESGRVGDLGWSCTPSTIATSKTAYSTGYSGTTRFKPPLSTAYKIWLPLGLYNLTHPLSVNPVMTFGFRSHLITGSFAVGFGKSNGLGRLQLYFNASESPNFKIRSIDDAGAISLVDTGLVAAKSYYQAKLDTGARTLTIYNQPAPHQSAAAVLAVASYASVDTGLPVEAVIDVASTASDLAELWIDYVAVQSGKIDDKSRPIY